MPEPKAKITVELDNQPAAKGAAEVVKSTQDMEKKVVQSAKNAGEAVEQIGKKAKAASDQLATAAQKGAGAITEMAKKQRQLDTIAARGVESRSTSMTRGIEDRLTVRTRQQEQRETDLHRADLALRNTRVRRREVWLKNAQAAFKKEQEFIEKQEQPLYSYGWQQKITRTPANQLLSRDINRAINRQIQNQQFYQGLNQGMSPSQVWQQQMNQAIARSNAQGAAQMIPGAFGPPPPGGGRGGGGRRGILSRLLGGGGGGIAGGFISGALGGLGIGIGGYAAARAARATIEATETAVAYERQRVAAERLAGSSEKLNSLLDAYGRASGGAIDKTTTLANVTRLLATGFADTVGETERFVKATRGAAIALGKPQDYVIQETQLAISNTSVKRLDQIGLGIREVQERVKELRKENAGWTREVAFQEAVLGLLDEKYGELTKTVEGQKTGLELLRAAWSDLILAFGQGAQGPINSASRALANLINKMAELERIRQRARQGDVTLDPNAPGRAGLIVRSERDEALMARRVWRAEDRLGLSWIERQVREISRAQLNARRALSDPLAMNMPFGGRRGYEEVDGVSMRSVPPASWRDRMGEEKMAIIDAGYQQSLQIERNYHKARMDAIRQYEEQRTNIIREYNKQMAREEEDFQRQRARSERDYQRAIVDLLRDSQEKRADLARDYQEKLADLQENLDEKLLDLREDSEKRIKDMQEKYQKDRERAEADHRDRLLQAAARLDAMAVYQEQKRWARENKEREEGYKEALEKEKESLQERIDDAQKAYDKQVQEAKKAYDRQLEDQRRADERRLEEMRVARERQLEDEDEDRRIRLERAKEDHNAQLEELDRQHGLTMDRLAEEAQEQRDLLQEALEKDLDAVGVYIEGYQQKMDERDKAIEKWFDKILDKIEKVIEADRKREEALKLWNPGGGEVQAFASGGYVPFTGPAILHSGEYVLNAQTVRNLDALNGGMGGMSWNGDVNVTIAGSTNMNESAMYKVARQAFGDALRELQPA